MKRTFTSLSHAVFPGGWYSLLLFLLFLSPAGIQAQALPTIDATNGLVPACATEEQALSLTINGSNFASQAKVRIRGTAFTGEFLITPAVTPSANQISIALAANSAVLAAPGTLTIDVQQPNSGGTQVFSNAVQLPVYPRTGAVSGPAAVCGNTQQSYSVPRLAGAASYEWSVLSGNATIAAGATNTARVSFSNTAGTVSIAVTTIHTCGTTGSTATLDIQVNAAPTVSLAAFTNVCANAPAFALGGGSPAGGTYTVNGVVATTFNPATAGAGTHTITYFFTQNGCTASATQTITVLAAPAVSLAAFSNVCVDAPAFALSGGSPAGGTYSGPGVTGTTFDPAAAGAGTHTITYTLTQGGCTASAARTITVFAKPAVSLAAFSNVCVDAPAFALTGGSPAGGTYTVNGTVATTFNPATAGLGTHTITYTVTQNGCTATAARTIGVVAVPEVTFAAPSPICVNAAPIALTGGEPAGGTYRGPGVTANTFNPATAGVGTHTLIYTFTQEGCAASATAEITVLDIPEAGIVTPAGGTQACPGAFVSLSATPTASGATYQWLFNGNPIAGAVDSTYNAGATGSYQVQVTANSCTAVSAAVAVTILDPSNILVEQAPVTYCAEGYIVLHAVTGVDYSYQWIRNGTEVTGQTASTLTVTQPGSYQVVLTAGSGCAPITSDALAVTETPGIAGNTISTTNGTAFCTGTTVELTGAVPTGGTGTYLYQWQRRENNGYWVDITGATGKDYTYDSDTFAGTISFRREVTSGFCTATSNELTLTFSQVIANNTLAAPAGPICAGQAPGTITGSTATGAPDLVYSWESRINGTAFALIPGANTPDYSPGPLTRSTIFRRVVSSGSCFSTSEPVTITVQPAIAGNSIAAPALVICSNTDAGTLTGGTLTGGDGTYSFGWESSADGTTFTAIPGASTATFGPGMLTQTTTFRRLVTSGTCTDTSNAFTITVNEVITGNTISVPDPTVCTGAFAATITGDPLAGGNGTYSFVWESSPDGTTFTAIPGGNTATFGPGMLTQTTTFRRLVTSGACTDTSNAVTLTLEAAATYTVLLTVPAGLPVCGETQYQARVIRNVSFIQYPADDRLQPVTWEGGEDVTNQFVFDWWQSDAQSQLVGNTSGTVTLAALQPGTYYTVRARPASGVLDCAIYNNRPDLIPANAGADLLFSNRIYSGHAEGYGVSVVADVQGPICPGTPVTFTAFPNDPAYVNQSYQWMVNQLDIPGASQPTFTATDIRDGDVISVRFNSDENGCSPVIAANPDTMQLMTPIVNEIAYIEGPAKPAPGGSATYQAIPADSTIGWRYQWVITYADDREETLPETGATLTITSFPAGVDQITATQIAPAGNCVDLDRSSLDVFTVPLPVELLYLKANKKGRQVVVEWATAMEQHNAGFEVQVSADAETYRPLGFVPSKNPHATAKQLYSFPDQENGQSGTRYYRLKQVDLTGETKYYGPVAVKMDELAARIHAYPNPFGQEIHLDIEAPETGHMHLVMLNALGSKVAERTLQVQKGLNKEVLSLSFHLPPGVYTLLTQMNGRSSRLKLLKN